MGKKRPTATKLAAALKERDEALEQLAATAAILKVIRRSPGDTQPVFDAIVRSALRLVGGHSALVLRLSGDMLHLEAHSSTSASGDEALKRFYPQPAKAVYLHGKAIRARRPFCIADTESVPASMADVKSMAQKRGYRSLIVVPMLREGLPIGSIGVSRRKPGEFSKHQIRTLEAFADQAVIAIENARLFNETREALERQTATSEILKVISSSPTATQPVFESIVKNCHSLFGDSRVALWQISDDRLVPRASTGYFPEPMPIDKESGTGACVLESRTIHLPDLRSALSSTRASSSLA